MDGRSRVVQQAPDGVADVADELSKRLQSGDQSVLGELENGCRDWVVGALCPRFEDLGIEDLDECFSDALLQLWNYRERIDGRAKLVTLLFKIARCRALDRRRSESTTLRPVHLEDWSVLASQVSRLKGNGMSTDDPELRQLVEKTLVALDSLAPKYETILRLDASAAGVTSSKVIEEITGIPREQVPTYRARARRALEKKLREGGVLPPDREGGCSGN